MIKRKHVNEGQETVAIGHCGHMPSWEVWYSGCAEINARAVGKNDSNEKFPGGFLEVSITERGSKSTRRASILLTSEEAKALQDTLNAVTWG
jgi:hypothetical protein